MKEIKKSKWLFLKLFFDAIVINAIAFGGGFVVLQSINEKYVKKLGWFTEDEMTDLMGIAQSVPGTIAGNALILIGYYVGGLFGAIVVALGSIIPAIIIITVVFTFYNEVKDNTIIRYIFRGMQCAVAGIILSLCVDMTKNGSKKGKDIFAIVIMVLALFLSFIIGINAVYIILAGAIIGIIYALVVAPKTGGRNK